MRFENNQLDNISSVLRSEKDFWDRVAEGHTNLSGAVECWEMPLRRYQEKVMGDISGKKVLDLGCGLGQASIWLCQKGGIVTGVDISEASIRKAYDLAKYMGLSIEFKVGNADELDYENVFDIVFCQAFLHHLPDVKKSLCRYRSYLIQGGLIIAQEPKAENPIALIARKFPSLQPTTETEHPFKIGELESLFKDVFGEAKVRYFYLLSPLHFIFSRIKFLRSKKLSKASFWALNALDKLLLLLPWMRKYTWVEIIYARKRDR